VQIGKAHSTAWPLGLPNPVQLQKNFRRKYITDKNKDRYIKKN